MTILRIKNLERGFTINELVIVMAVFLFIIGAALTIFISVVQHQRRVLAEQELLNQMSYITEFMSKALRMAKKSTTEEDATCIESGSIYKLTRQCTSSTDCSDAQVGFYRGIRFINASDSNRCEEFYLDSTTDPQHPVLKVLKTANDSDAIPITAQKLIVNSIKFGLDGCNGRYGTCPENVTEDDPVQPRVTVSLQIQIPGDSQQQIKKIQTTVSERNLNIK